MSTALDVFRVVASEFSATVDADVEAMIVIVGARISTVAFSSMFDQAKAYLAAHEYAMIARMAAAGSGMAGAGSIASVRAGDLAIAYGGTLASSMSLGDDYYRTTPYGLAYLNLRASRALVGMGVIT